jgi:epoxyqueuosine reductase
MLALPYDSSATCSDRDSSRQSDESTQAARGKVARYARSQFDYHDIIHARLKELKNWLLQLQPSAQIRGVVDTAPLLEREFAAMAGLGWIGKNTLLLNKHWGSYFFLAALLTDLELDVDEPTHSAHCGTCTACLDACPTQAFPEPYVLDARKCISYTTIENREEVNATVAEHLQDWLFGCDICQEVCPWNRHEKSCDADLEPQQQDLGILDLLRIDESSYRERFRKTAFWRARRRGLLRNAILLAAAKNLHAAEPELVQLLYDAEPLLRKAAAWALHRLQPANWRSLLNAALEEESDTEAREDLERLLDNP